MASPDFYLCDKCGAKTSERLFVPTARKMDAAGSMETVGDNIDLCGKCAMRAVNFLLGCGGDDWETRGKALVVFAERKAK